MNKSEYSKVRKQNFTAYLGTPSERERRAEELRKLAERLADGKTSKLIQDIADGKLEVRRKEPA